MWKSLRFRLTIIFIGLAVIPVLAVGSILSQRSFRAEQVQALALQQQVAERVTGEIEHYFGDVENDLILMGGDIRNLQSADRAQELSLLLGAVSTGDYRDVYRELTLLDSTGAERMRLSRVEVVASEDLNDRSAAPEYLVTKELRETYYGPIWYDETGEPHMTIAIPIYQIRSVELSAVLIADVRMRAVRNLIAGLQIKDQQVVYVIDAQSRVISYPDPLVVTSQTVFPIQDEEGRFQGLSGIDSLFVKNPLEFGQQTFAVVVERPVAEALAVAQTSVYIGMAVTTVALLVAVGLVLLTVIQIVRPIEVLSSVAQRIREGDFSARANIQNQDELGQLAHTFNDMAAQLSQLIENLENRVQERTRDLNIASQVSQQVTRVLDMNELLPHLSDLTKEGFNLGHVSVFVYDAKDDILRLEAGSGEAGQRMMKAGKQFKLNDHGLVPLAARNLEAQIINDVYDAPDFLPNPILPDTRSEMAVPMRVGTQLIGVLDLQSEEVDHFTEEHVNVLNTLADQIAIAVRNADLFTAAAASRAEAEQANIVKSQFLAAMSHELRTPLNAVLNFTQFVSTGMLGEVNSDQVDMLDKVVQSGKHLLSLINDVLDISKIEAGALKLFVEDDVNLAKEVETVVAAAQSLVAEKPITIHTDIDAALPLIKGDKRRLRQIMLNLVSNACKFTDEGIIEISLIQERDMIRFAVKDSGPGIAPEDQGLIFETFRQTSTGLRQGEGTGLGLPISLRLAETHGGKLWLESAVGAGSTFYFTVPVNNSDLTPMVKRKDMETNHVA